MSSGARMPNAPARSMNPPEIPHSGELAAVTAGGLIARRAAEGPRASPGRRGPAG